MYVYAQAFKQIPQSWYYHFYIIINYGLHLNALHIGMPVGYPRTGVMDSY